VYNDLINANESKLLQTKAAIDGRIQSHGDKKCYDNTAVLAVTNHGSSRVLLKKE
jgi:hypothetical protein